MKMRPNHAKIPKVFPHSGPRVTDEYPASEQFIMKKKEVIEIEFRVHDEKRFVEIWLTGDEARDERLKKRLLPLYRKYKSRSYFVAVYESGRQDLTEGMKSLLKHNRELSERPAERGSA